MVEFLCDMYENNPFISLFTLAVLAASMFFFGILFLSYLAGAAKEARRADKKNDGTADALASHYRMLAVVFLLLVVLAAGIFFYFNFVLDIDFF